MTGRVTRRTALQAIAGFGVMGARSVLADEVRVVLPFANGERTLVAYPQKRPLIAHTQRPINLETPFEVFNQGVITPNDAFFVRYSTEPVTTVRLDLYRLLVRGTVATPLSLTLEELKAFEPVELVAVNQCSGNGRGLFTPRVGGGQVGNGVMGNARWKGVPLKAVLEKAGVAPGSVHVVFDGLDSPIWPRTPDFRKALDVDHALDSEVMLAWSMNGADLPMLNGYPVRLVVPGYYGTYWVKHLRAITVLDAEFDGYYMKKTYQVPDNECACVPPGGKPDAQRPLGRLNVRSFITSLADGATVQAGKETVVKGIAFDGGHGIESVAFSDDGGLTWRAAKLGADLGRHSFREWESTLTLPASADPRTLLARAVNRIGHSQPMEPLWNPSGYQRNVVERVTVTAVEAAP